MTSARVQESLRRIPPLRLAVRAARRFARAARQAFERAVVARRLRRRYRRPAERGSGAAARPAQPLARHEARAYSQNGEDGILLHLFSLLGTAGRTFVEFGCGDGKECISANLALHWGWRGLLMDADARNVEAARRFYARAARRGGGAGVRVVPALVTPDNIDEILRSHGVTGEIDLLTVDIDGNDYWVWESISVVRPRVTVVEYNASLGSDRSLSVPYDAGFDRYAKHPSGYYHGASLAALAKLGERRGLVLVGCDSTGVNAFFVRREEAGELLQPLAPAEAFVPDARRGRRHSPEEQFRLIEAFPFVEI